MLNFDSFERKQLPFPHWVSTAALAPEITRTINAEWPTVEDPNWYVENVGYVRKSALMFPKHLPDMADMVASALYSAEHTTTIARMLKIPTLQPDPWFREGPEIPRLGGGLHEISTGGLLGMHLDFDAHPTGLVRAVNLLIYLNEEWDEAWGGKLELHSSDHAISYAPKAGTAVLFQTDDRSWHGHPEPLQCPPDRARRSLALYYYKVASYATRKTTLYRKKA